MRCLLPVLLAGLASAPAAAQVAVAIQPSAAAQTTVRSAPAARSGPAVTQELSFPESQLKVLVWSSWPDMLYQGFLPLTLQIENLDGREHAVDITLTRSYGSEQCSVLERVSVAAGAHEELQLAVPAGHDYGSNGYNVFVTVAGRREMLYNVGATQHPDPNVWPVLYVHSSARTPSAGANLAWAAEFSARPPAAVPLFTDTSARMVRMGSLGYAGSSATAGGAGTFQVGITPLAHEELPARFEPYTSLKAVVLDAPSGLPAPGVVDALCSWVRLGGVLACEGPGAEELARSVPALAAWMEPRFVLRTDGGNTVYACAQGVLVVGDGRDLQQLASGGGGEFAELIDAFQFGLTRPVSFADSPHARDALMHMPKLADMELPYRMLTLLLVCFAILIGPVNLLVVRRLNRPALLLVTVPLLAIVFSIGLFVYGAVSQGLNVRGAVFELTWLDQRTHQASTLSTRSLFAGMPAGDGWRVATGSAVFPLEYPGGVRQGELRIDCRAGLTYGGDYLPVRRERMTAGMVDRAARARLEVVARGDELELGNGLGAAIRHLVVCDANGVFYELETPLAAGEKTRLGPAADQASASVRHRARLPGLVGALSHEQLFAGSYVAELDAPVFGDHGEVDIEVENGTQLVLGILELGGGR